MIHKREIRAFAKTAGKKDGFLRKIRRVFSPGWLYSRDERNVDRGTGNKRRYESNVHLFPLADIMHAVFNNSPLRSEATSFQK